MSRSKRAWLESCPTGAVSFIQRLSKVLAVGMLVFSLAPASALAGSASGKHAKSSPTQKTQRSAHARAQAGVLALGDGYGGHGSAAVRALQRRLVRAGDAPGPIDGRYGPRTEQAVIRLQASDGLAEDGIAGPLTLAALSRSSAGLYPGAGYADHGSRAVRVLQRELVRAGDAPGPIDGRYGPRTARAVSRFQAAHRLRADGIAGPRTLARLSARRKPPQAVRRSSPSPPAGLPEQALRLAQGGHLRLQATPAWARGAHVRKGHGHRRVPALPVTLVLLGLAVLGLTTMSLSYARMRTRAERARARVTARPQDLPQVNAMSLPAEWRAPRGSLVAQHEERER